MRRRQRKKQRSRQRNKQQRWQIESSFLILFLGLLPFLAPPNGGLRPWEKCELLTPTELPSGADRGCLLTKSDLGLFVKWLGLFIKLPGAISDERAWGGRGINGAPIRKRSGTCPGGLPCSSSADTIAWPPSWPISPTSLSPVCG